MREITATDLENLHNIVLKKFNITPGVKDRGLLDAIADRPSQTVYNRESFPDLYLKTASMMEAIIRWHPFTDGNKRTALVAVSAYLAINGYLLIVPLSAVRYTVNIAKNQKTDAKSNAKLVKSIAKWIKKHSAPKDDNDEILRVFNKRVRKQYQFLYYAARSVILKKLIRFQVENWLAIDIYPEYAKETEDIVEFLRELLTYEIFKDKQE